MKGRLTIGFLVASLFLLLVAPLACARAPLKLSDVKQGKITAQEYLDYLAKNVPELKQAGDSGILEGIIYNPPEDNLRVKLNNLLRECLNGEKLEEATNDSLKSFREDKEKTVFRVLPALTYLSGKHCSLYILGYPLLLMEAQTDADVENMLLHELQHVRDVYEGVRLNGYFIGWQQFEANATVTIGFWKSLLEVRAYHLELVNIFLELKKNEHIEKTYSLPYMTAVALSYGEYYNELKKIAAAPLEVSMATIQLEQYQDIVPTFLGEDLLLEFNMEGQKAALKFIKQEE